MSRFMVTIYDVGNDDNHQSICDADNSNLKASA